MYIKFYYVEWNTDRIKPFIQGLIKRSDKRFFGCVLRKELMVIMMKRNILSFLCVLALAANPLMGLAAENTAYESDIISENAESYTDNSEVYINENDKSDVCAAEQDEVLEDNDELIVFSDTDKTALLYIINNLKKNIQSGVNAGNEDALNEMLKKAEDIYNNSNAAQDEIDAAVDEIKQLIGELSYAEEIKIISGNKFSDFQLADKFNGLEIAKNDVKYEYSDSSPSVLKTADTAQKLSNGKLDDYISTNSTDTGNTELIYDFGEDYYICGTELYSGFYYNKSSNTKRNRRNVGKYTVYVSDDGVDYTAVCEAKAKTLPDENDTDDLVNYVISTKSDIAAVKTRYVKIEIEKDSESIYYQLGEMVLKGFRIPPGREMLLETINMCGGVDAAIYETDSFNEWKRAWTEAERVWFDEAAQEDELKECARNLKSAYASLKKSGGQYILSGNLKKSDDLLYYDGYSNLYGANVTYTYEGAAAPEWNNSDKQLSTLLGGNLQSTSRAYGSWDARTGDIIVDLHRNCYMNRADLWAVHTGSSCVNGITVYVSDDGSNYIKAGEYSYVVPEDEPEDKVVKHAVEFDKEVSGRYVKFSLSTTKYQLCPSEIVIMGMPGSEIVKSAPMTLSKVQYTDADGTMLYTLNNISGIKVSGQVLNTTDEVQAVKIITAVYNENGQLIDMILSDKTIAAGGAVSFENNLDADDLNSGCSVDTYVWSGFLKGRPLSKIKSFGAIE